MGVITGTPLKAATATQAAPPQASQNFKAVAPHVPTNGGSALYSTGDVIMQSVDYSTGVPIESYYNLSTTPNTVIPNDVFAANFTSGDIVAMGIAANTTIVKELLDWVVVELTSVPQTLSELFTAASLTFPPATAYVQYRIDPLTFVAGDLPKIATFPTVVADGEYFESGDLDAANEIQNAKFVVVPLVAMRNTKMFIRCYNAKN